MPAARRPEYDSQEFYDLWHSDTHIEDIGRRYGVSCTSVHLAAMNRGFPGKYALRKKNCKVSGCDRPSHCQGYCRAHYQRRLIGADMSPPIRGYNRAQN